MAATHSIRFPALVPVTASGVIFKAPVSPGEWGVRLLGRDRFIDEKIPAQGGFTFLMGAERPH